MNDISQRFYSYTKKVDVTKPDGNKETFDSFATISWDSIERAYTNAIDKTLNIVVKSQTEEKRPVQVIEGQGKHQKQVWRDEKVITNFVMEVNRQEDIIKYFQATAPDLVEAIMEMFKSEE